eukprot:737786-Pelagomonas_calceolata.AAC.1
MVTELHNIVSRIPLKGVSKGPLGAGLASMGIGSADRLALQNLQIPEHSTNGTLPKRKEKTRLRKPGPAACIKERSPN